MKIWYFMYFINNTHNLLKVRQTMKYNKKNEVFLSYILGTYRYFNI